MLQTRASAVHNTEEGVVGSVRTCFTAGNGVRGFFCTTSILVNLSFVSHKYGCFWTVLTSYIGHPSYRSRPGRKCVWKIKADNLPSFPSRARSLLRVGPINFATYGWPDCSVCRWSPHCFRSVQMDTRSNLPPTHTNPSRVMFRPPREWYPPRAGLLTHKS